MMTPDRDRSSRIKSPTCSSSSLTGMVSMRSLQEGDGHHVVDHDDLAAVLHVLTLPDDLPIELVAPRDQELLQQELEPPDVVVELLTPVVDDRTTVLGGDPVAPVAQLGTSVVTLVPGLREVVEDLGLSLIEGVVQGELPFEVGVVSHGQPPW